MTELPIHPDRQGGAGQELARRRDRIAERAKEAPGAYRKALEELAMDCVYETLRLTGEPLEREVVGRAALEKLSSVGRHFAALDTIERQARENPDWNPELLQEVHRLTSRVSPGQLRTTSTSAQFGNARPAEPSAIEPKLRNLGEWLSTETGRDMLAAERAALAFARVVEIAPFERGNFRSAHFMMSFFSLADGYPYVYFRLEEADRLREDVERAFQFDTLPLVNRVTESLGRSLSLCEKGLGLTE